MSQLTKPTEIEVNSSDPWANDVLDRREVANFISPDIASIQQPYVISIHSPYGTGKTFFVKRWRQDLENQKFKTIYFNAWETDLSNDPLVAFMSAVEREVEKWEAKKKTSQAKEKFSEWSCPELVRKTSAFISTKTLPILLCAAARKALDSDAFDELAGLSDATEEEITNVIGDFAKDQLTLQRQAEDSIQAFKAYLSDVLKSVTKAQKDDSKKKIIIFIDEMDRCRPTYAVQVLECIKHLFSVNGFIFVLAVDKPQLLSSVKSVYGSDIDGEGYLKRFIDLHLQLPEPSRAAFSRLSPVRTSGTD